MATADLPAVRELFALPPWSERADELESIAEDAAAGESDEYDGLVAVERDRIVCAVLYRRVTGAEDTGELECVCAIGDAADAIRQLLDAAITALRDGGARLIVAEFPGSAAFESYAAALHGAGFRDEANVADYFREGEGLQIAVWRRA